jgi:hypothetical protein
MRNTVEPMDDHPLPFWFSLQKVGHLERFNWSLVDIACIFCGKTALAT